MSRSDWKPTVGVHKQTGRFRFTIKRKHTLCPPGCTRAEAESMRDRYLSEFTLSGRVSTNTRNGPLCGHDEIIVAEVIDFAWRWVKSYYGPQSTEPGAFKIVFDLVVRLYGPTAANDFGPVALKVVRQAMVVLAYPGERGCCCWSFIDCPYWRHSSKSGDQALYDHVFTQDQHVQLRDRLAELDPDRHKFLMTIDESELTHRLYGTSNDFFVYDRSLSYGMTDNGSREIVRELVVSNERL
ncbi:MAG: hypothetical protein ACYTHJ_16035 [Planctomycetota bacterium]|jgi:hypothetical protein